MNISITETERKEYQVRERVDITDESGTLLSTAGIRTVQSRFCGKHVSTLLIGGVATAPYNRRLGCVRKALEHLLSIADERKWDVAMLHPFDAAYYNKFGFEKVADHKILEFPLDKLSFLPRCSDLLPLDSEERLNDVLAVYEKFAARSNGMFRRFDSTHYNVLPNAPKNWNRYNSEPCTFIWYDETGKAASYITVKAEKYLDVNRMVPVALHVHEYAFTSPESLKAILGFLRMFDGELDSVKIHNCSMAPEIDAMLRSYTHTSYTLVSDIQARILNVRTFLEANEYPRHAGSFRVFVDDYLPNTRGLWEVHYENGVGTVEKISDEPEGYDLYTPIDAFTKLVYGYESYTQDQLTYIDGVKIGGDCTDFLAAFPKRNTGLFEHF